MVCKGEFTASGVHKHFGISFKTPKYPNQLIKEDVRVRICHVVLLEIFEIIVQAYASRLSLVHTLPF